MRDSIGATPAGELCEGASGRVTDPVMGPAMGPVVGVDARGGSIRDSVAAVVVAIQVTPPSTVRRQVPPLPLAHATLSSTTHSPRRLAKDPLDCGSKVQDGGINSAGAGPAQLKVTRIATTTAPALDRWIAGVLVIGLSTPKSLL